MPAGDAHQLRDATSLALKVDVDTRVGLLEGVPRLAGILAAHQVRASFFLAMGPDNSGRALRRLVKPGFLAKQMRSGAARAYGPRTMLQGLLLPGPIIGWAAPGLVRRLLEQGHEVGLHGWDHVFWHDRLRSREPSRLDRELEQAAALYKSISGQEATSFAAPGWQITPQVFGLLAARGMSHVSCTRGQSPFRPLLNGRALPLLELPTTLPTMDELLGREGVGPAQVAGHLAGLVRPGRLNVFTLHAEVEGRALAGPFSELLARLKGDGVRLLRLVDAARQTLQGPTPPAQDIAWGPVAGRAGLYAWQATALKSGGAA